MAPSRAYVGSALPLEFQSEVVVTDASLGPARFSIRSKYSNWEYLSMCLELELFQLDQLPAYPLKGTPCIAKVSENWYRGLVLSTNWDQNSSNIRLVDFGYVHAVSHNMLFDIPDEILSYPMFSTSVALADGEALSKKPGLNEIFTAVVSIPDFLWCDVVEVEGTLQKVILYTPKDENITHIVLGLHNNLAPKYRALSPAIPKIEEPPATSISSAPKSASADAHRFGSSKPSTGVSSAFGNASDGTSMTASAGGLCASPNAVYENRSVFRSSGSIEIPVCSRAPSATASASASFGQQRSTGFDQHLVKPEAFGRASALEVAPRSFRDFRASPMINQMKSGASQNAAGSSTFGASLTAQRSSVSSAMPSPKFGQQNSTAGMVQSTAVWSPSAFGDASAVIDAQYEQQSSFSFITASKPSTTFDVVPNADILSERTAAVTASPLLGQSPAVTTSSAFDQEPVLMTSLVFGQPNHHSISPASFFNQPTVSNAGLNLLFSQVKTATLSSNAPTSAFASVPISIENLLTFHDLHQPLQDVKADVLKESNPVIDLLVPISQDPILVSVVQVLVESSSDSTAIRNQSTVKKDQVLSVFDEEEPPKSDTMFNQSVLTAKTALIGSVTDEQKAGPIVVSDEPYIQIYLQRIIPVEQEQQKAKILTKRGEKDASNSFDLDAIKDDEASDLGLDCTVRDEEKSVAPADPFALLGSVVHEEKETTPLLKEVQDSDPASSNLLAYEDDVDSKLPFFIPFLQEVATSADEKLKDSTIFDKPFIQIELHQATPVEEEQQTASILSEGEEESASDPGESIAVKDAAASVIHFALSESIFHEEKEIASPLEEDQDSDPGRTDLLVYKDGFDVKLPTFVQLLDGELNDPAPTFFFPHSHPTHSLDSEVGEEQAFVLEFINDLKPQLLTEEESVTEPVDVNGVEEESLGEQAVELVDKHSTLFQPFEASTSDVKEVSDPGDPSPVPLPSLHFAAQDFEAKQAESPSSVTEKENERELVVEEEQKLESNIETSQNTMEQSLSSTPDQSILDESSKIDLFNVPRVCNSEEKIGKVDDQSASDFMDDSLFKELLNGPTDSQSDWTTDVATNLSMIEKVLDDSVEDPSITSSGEIDEIPDQSIPTVTVY